MLLMYVMAQWNNGEHLQTNSCIYSSSRNLYRETLQNAFEICMHVYADGETCYEIK